MCSGTNSQNKIQCVSVQSKWNPVCSGANSQNEIQCVPVQTVKIKSIFREHLAVRDNAKCKTCTAAGQGVISILLKLSSQSQPVSRHSHCKCDTWPPFFAIVQSASINLVGNSCEGFFSRCMHPLYTHTHTHTLNIHTFHSVGLSLHCPNQENGAGHRQRSCTMMTPATFLMNSTRDSGQLQRTCNGCWTAVKVQC